MNTEMLVLVSNIGSGNLVDPGPNSHSLGTTVSIPIRTIHTIWNNTDSVYFLAATATILGMLQYQTMWHWDMSPQILTLDVRSICSVGRI
jgi:hypothetical protein